MHLLNKTDILLRLGNDDSVFRPILQCIKLLPLWQEPRFQCKYAQGVHILYCRNKLKSVLDYIAVIYVDVKQRWYRVYNIWFCLYLSDWYTRRIHLSICFIFEMGSQLSFLRVTIVENHLFCYLWLRWLWKIVMAKTSVVYFLPMWSRIWLLRGLFLSQM